MSISACRRDGVFPGFEPTPATSPHAPLETSINLGTVPVFGEGDGSLPFHIIEELGRGPLHRIAVSPPQFDLVALGKRFQAKLLRTESELDLKGKLVGKYLLLRTRGGVFVICRPRLICAYGTDQQAAARIVARLLRMARALTEPRKAGYFLLERSFGSIGTEEVPLTGIKPSEPGELGLLYGAGFPEWNDDFVSRFNETHSGLTVLEGPPGTGKTSFLRHLMTRHLDTHCFYYIAPHDIHCLIDSDFISHWAREREKHEGKKMALIIEDAEQALMARDSDNRSLVQIILNYADGMLADFIRVQIIATVNCRASELDEALLRPGRLMARRYFGRLQHSDACRLAAHHGLPLPKGQEDYSLAEIFHKRVHVTAADPKILGFAA